MDIQGGAIIIHGKVGFTSHVVRHSAPVKGFFQDRLSDRVIQGRISKIDHIRKAVGIVISFIRARSDTTSCDKDEPNHSYLKSA